jgi:hypothetical protein
MFYFAAASHTEMARRLEDTRRQTPDASGGLAGSQRLFLRIDHPTFGPAFAHLTQQLITESTRTRGALRGGADEPRSADAGRRSAGAAGAWNPDTLEAVGSCVGKAIEPLNIAGLCDPGKRNWYPVDLRDLIENAEKLGMNAVTMEHWLEAAGWTVWL